MRNGGLPGVGPFRPVVPWLSLRGIFLKVAGCSSCFEIRAAAVSLAVSITLNKSCDNPSVFTSGTKATVDSEIRKADWNKILPL